MHIEFEQMYEECSWLVDKKLYGLSHFTCTKNCSTKCRSCGRLWNFHLEIGFSISLFECNPK